MKLSITLAWLSLLALPLFLFAGCGEGDGCGEQYCYGFNYSFYQNYYGPCAIGPGVYYNAVVYPYGYGVPYCQCDHQYYGCEVGRASCSEPSGYEPVPVTAIITGYGVQPTASPLLVEYKLTAENVNYTTHPFHVASIGSSHFSTRTTTENINQYLNARPHTGAVPVQDICMTISPQQVKTTVLITMDNCSVTAVSTGRLQKEGDKRVVYVPDSFTVNNVPLPAEVQQDILRQINPVVDLNGLHSAPRIREVKLGTGETIINGTAKIQPLP